ncbi:conserved hypothetical protein [Coccidioides posadasii str. Silveira]|uniref:Uncharacterized protein n=2 Tax=Coccidioides posadasii TaxID=199306 RepID=E9CY17_COCPS|nr:conserved hypothetical protein [Coccidioides posadasii str. Silveira]KMM72601.1 hypothetical protein CPAG_08895 [Coccidioides posadasii RMSCC 3488]
MLQRPLDLDEKFSITIHNKTRNIFPGDCAVAKLSDKPFVSMSNLHGGLTCLLISPTAVIICNFSPLTTQAAGRRVFARLKKERDKYKQDLRCDGYCRARLILLLDVRKLLVFFIRCATDVWRHVQYTQVPGIPIAGKRERELLLLMQGGYISPSRLF